MATKAQMYAQMADHAAVQLTSSWNEWMRFLDTASRLYKYPFHDQLMIYAQRPDATACAEYDLWNDKMGRYVRRGSKGIALVDDSGDRTRLRYVFDISDTGTRPHSRTPWLWKMEERHIDSISAMLENRYGVGGDDLGGQLTEIARRLAGEYWADNGRDFLYIVDDSFLEEYDELNIEVQFKAAATVSIAYSLMSRCGLAPEQYFTHEDFMPVFDFNTPATVGALGTAVSQINQQVLRQIGVTILNAEREANKERSQQNEQHLNLHSERGLSDSQPATDRTARNAPGQVRQDAENLLEGSPAPPLQPSADEREAVPAPVGDRPDREQPIGAADAGTGAGGGRDRGTESPRHDAVGGPDEQLQGPGGGDSAGGTYQQLTLNLFLSEAEQIQNIDEAENVKASSAFSFAQKDIDHTEPPQPALEDVLEQYRPVVTAAIMEDTAYRNACGHTDHENAVIEGNAAVRRAVLGSGDLQLLKQYSDVPEFRHRLHQEVIAETYPKLHELLRPLSQDDIDEALCAWNGDMDSKRAVVRYMKEHGREKDTAAWLSREYGGPEHTNLFIVRAGSPETIELPWPKVQRRIAQLIKEDRFFTEAERDNLDDIDPIAIRENLAQRGIVNGQVVEPEKLDNDPFIQQVMADVDQIAADEAEPRFSVVMTSDAFPDPEDAFAVWDNQTNDYYTASDGTVRTFSREEDADQFLTGLEPQEVNADRQEEPKKGGFAYGGFHFEPVGVLGEDSDFNTVVRHTISNNALGMSVYANARRPYSHAAFYAAAGGIKADVFRCLENGKLYLPGSNELFEYTGAFKPYQEQAKEPVQETTEAETAPAADEPGTLPRDPLASAYGVGDFVFLENTEYRITDLQRGYVQLNDPALAYPIYRTESKEQFERAIRQDPRNSAITDYLPADLDQFSPDLREVLTGEGGLLDTAAKEDIAALLRSGAGNPAVAQHLSQRFSGTVETMQLETGDTADYRASATGMEVEILREDETVLAALYESWEPLAAALRALYQQELDGFSHEPAQPSKQLAEEQPDFGNPPAPEPEPQITITPVTRYPGEQNHLPYDIEIHTLRFDEPEPTPPQPTAGNFRITDIHLGEGGPKAKFRANMDAINLLKELEFENRQATPEEQETLSRYVGWGGLSDAFDESKPAWAKEFAELYATLSPEEYEAARGTTLNAHYTSPTVIQAIYEAVGKMGFQTGNILEPSCGVGNFFGMLPEEMRGSKLYGVELDSITGRIAKQLYPKADITIAGFQTTDRRDFYDLAVGNVPFGQYSVNDRAYNKLNFNIHNYFFAKSLDQVRPGGVVAFVTSRYTMDSKDSTVRRYLAQRAELLGAIRLPNNAFKANAGTEVVSDIIFLQKRDRPIDIAPDWTQTGQTEEDFTINRYFLDHPEMVLGRQEPESTAHGMDYTVNPIEGLELSDQLHDAIKYIRGTYQEAELPELGEGEEIDTSIPADPDVKNYSYTVVDGAVYYRENSRMVRPDLNATAEARIKGLVELRDCVQKLIAQQMDSFVSDAAIRETQAELNRLYDAFSAKYGLINDRGNRLAFADDSSYYLLCALEVIDDEGQLKQKADMFTKRTIKPHQAVTAVDTASEALAVSIAEKAEVDMAYMAELSGKTQEELAQELRGVIFRLPGPLAEGESPRYVTADEYLSGNVRRKLRQAQRAADKDPAFSVNVEALTAAQPKDLDASEIEVRLGATWIDKDYIQQFMYETFHTPYYLQGKIEVKYVPYTAEWQITGKNAVGYGDVAANTTYGTDRANAYKILEDSLNLRDVRIYDTVEDAEGRERRVLNAKETTLAAQKQMAIREAFRDWIWKDPQRRQTLVRQYNEEMNSIRPREYDGQHIRFAGMNPEITLREHQKNAIAHVLYGGNTLLAHEVGAGKTFEMVAAAMESKRLGLCQKSLFVVPNHLTEQWASEFLRLYPSANILVTTKKDFESHNRKKFCARIATGDYDAVIIGHSQFERIPISRERQERLLREQINEITDGIAEVEASGGERFTVKQLERTKKSLEARLEKLQAEGRKDDVITFEQLGVDRLFVDESHNYKNLFLYTKMRNVAGLSTTDAQKSSDMFAKCRYMDDVICCEL